MFDTPPTPSLARARRALAPLAAAALAAAGCGNAVPANGVARVGGDVIEKSEFNHWLNTAARAQQPLGGAPGQGAPDPPSFTRCVAAKQKQPVPKGGRKPTPDQLKTQCRQEYESLRDQVLQFLISAEWIQQEAEERDVEISDAVVNKQFEDQKKQSFPNDKAYQDFLKSSGQSEEDLRFRVRLDAISNEIRKKVVADKGKVTDAQIASYYEKNKARFAQPERRDIEVVLTKSRGKARQARAAIRRGRSFGRVARRFSIDEASKRQGGKLPGVSKGSQLEKPLERAVFRARRGQLIGPVKTQFGYYVVRVTKVTPPSQQSLHQARDTIRSLLRSQQEQKALNAFVKDFRERYRQETICAKGYVLAGYCKNGPKEEKPPTAPGGPPPQGGGAPQGAPPPQGQ